MLPFPICTFEATLAAVIILLLHSCPLHCIALLQCVTSDPLVAVHTADDHLRMNRSYDWLSGAAF